MTYKTTSTSLAARVIAALAAAVLAVAAAAALTGCGGQGAGASSSSAAASSGADAGKPTLTVAMELAYPPFETKDDAGNPEGIAVDFMQDFADAYG